MFYIVVKPFKSNGILFERGTVIADPSLVRRFILKVREGKILHVNLKDVKSSYKFDIMVQKYNLDKDAILKLANNTMSKPSKKKVANKKSKSKIEE